MGDSNKNGHFWTHFCPEPVQSPVSTLDERKFAQNITFNILSWGQTKKGMFTSFVSHKLRFYMKKEGFQKRVPPRKKRVPPRMIARDF